MAFTEAQKVKLRLYLGYPSRFRQEYYAVEHAFDVIGEQADTQTEVEAILAKLATIETSLTSAIATSGMKRAEDVEWYPGQARFEGVRNGGRLLCGRLSTIFEVPLWSDAFGEIGYTRRGNARGGEIPLG